MFITTEKIQIETIARLDGNLTAYGTTSPIDLEDTAIRHFKTATLADNIDLRNKYLTALFDDGHKEATVQTDYLGHTTIRLILASEWGNKRPTKSILGNCDLKQQKHHLKRRGKDFKV